MGHRPHRFVAPFGRWGDGELHPRWIAEGVEAPVGMDACLASKARARKRTFRFRPLLVDAPSARVGDGGEVRAAIRPGHCAILANLLWSAAARPDGDGQLSSEASQLGASAGVDRGG